MNQIQSWDDRRDYLIGKTSEEAIELAAGHWIHTAQRSIQQRGRFAVALSGGSTPKAIYEKLKTAKLDWSKVWLFWSDERAVPPDHPDSNYRMAMESGFQHLPIPSSQIFRMVAETNIEENALDYEEKISHHLKDRRFDLVMLGLGEDGHTASLFPETPALTLEDRLVAANLLAQKKTWRMTLTFPCIHQSHQAVLYALGPSKASILQTILHAPIDSPFPASKLGTHAKKLLLILDSLAASQIH